jgi:hypothetical protein
MTDALKRRLAGASVVLFDDTLWRDDEMIQLDVGPKTGRRMGHMRGDSMRQASTGGYPFKSAVRVGGLCCVVLLGADI